MQTERVGVVWKCSRRMLRTGLSRIVAESSSAVIFQLFRGFPESLQTNTRLLSLRFRSLAVLIFLKPFKDEKSESTFLSDAP